MNAQIITEVKQVSNILTFPGQSVSSIKDSIQAVTGNTSQNSLNAGVSAAQLADVIATIAAKEMPGSNLLAPISLVNNINQINNQLSSNQAVDSSLVYQAYADINAILASGAFIAAATIGSPVIAGLGAALVLAAGALTIIAVAQGQDAISPEFQNNLQNIYNAIQNYGNSDYSNPLLLPGSFDTRNCHPSDAVNTDFTTFSRYPQRSDPFTLDLDGDGLETVPPNSSQPILFDINNDGVKTSTGWIKPDDGFLALDRNGNGTIDNGAELFGDATPLSAGGTAKDGFAALARETR